MFRSFNLFSLLSGPVMPLGKSLMSTGTPLLFSLWGHLVRGDLRLPHSRLKLNLTFPQLFCSPLEEAFNW